MTAKKSGSSPDQRRKHDEAFKAGAQRLASESRSTPAAARELGIRLKRLYRWQQAQLMAKGHAVGRWRIRRVLKAHGLRAQPPRSFVLRTTDSDPAVRAQPLTGPAGPTVPNRGWVGDITYLLR